MSLASLLVHISVPESLLAKCFSTCTSVFVTGLLALGFGRYGDEQLLKDDPLLHLFKVKEPVVQKTKETLYDQTMIHLYFMLLSR